VKVTPGHRETTSSLLIAPRREVEFFEWRRMSIEWRTRRRFVRIETDMTIHAQGTQLEHWPVSNEGSSINKSKGSIQ